ncbi:hypothetical protein B0I21_102541 [Sphingobacterium paludis]|uniref:Uncharacterized protein n=1 Tax=Sphingobacterium paludis TaxID=1476465 RepID=A0A4R7D8H2_9SPHI|nr:hypothetical protein B0I21_102541 [Sphingobacterium paludis]
MVVPLLTAMSAVAPPGGCKVRVTCMSTIDKATANGAVSQMISGSTWATVTPAIAETTCPPIKLRGCAKGLSIAPYTKTEEAPKEPIRKIFSETGSRSDCKKAIKKIPTNAPRKDQKCSRGSTSVSL